VLFDPAMLSASGALTGVSEAFAVHESTTAVTANELLSAADHWLRNSPASVGFLGTAPLDPSLIPSLTGSKLLDQLAVQPDSSLGNFVNANPKAVKALLANPPVASRVAGLWASLSPSRQKMLARTAPQLVGNLEGVPFTVRDAANRLFLKETVATLTQRIHAGVGRAGLLVDRHHLAVLQQVERTVVTAKGAFPKQLVTFDPSGEVRAAVVVGDLSKADYVSYLVPGMFFTVQGQMYDWTVIAADLQKEQSRWIKLLGASDSSMAGKTAATVSWIGYSTPGVLDIASLAKANKGADFLGASINGLRAARVGDEPYISLITHSYGSTTAMIELAKGQVSVDALAIVGSPGSATQKASSLTVANDNVFVGEAALDPVVNTAFYGSDPGSISFGAHRMSVAGGIDAITHKTLGAAIGHLGYFDAGSEAMRNFALISLGEGTLVTDGTTADAARTLGTTTY
jgi:hypothetical protein